MLPLIVSGIVFSLWAIFIINIYYSTHYSSVDHVNVDYLSPLLEGFDGFFVSAFGKYLMSVVLIYMTYKIVTLFFLDKKELKFSILSIVGFFLIHLFVVCVIYTGLPEWGYLPYATGSTGWMKIFIHILSLVIYPIVLTLITRVAGRSILSSIVPTWWEKDKRITTLADIAIGFFVLSTLLLFVSSLGIFSLASLIVILIGMSILWWRHWKDTYRDIRDAHVVFENHTKTGTLIQKINPKLLSAEFAFFVLTLMMSVSMISIIRPMPIGWDDLGVYMNFPKMIALTGETLPGAGLYTWQQITATGFLFSYNAAQAFFVNQFGSILAIFAIGMWLSVIFERREWKSLLSLPLLMATLYYVMPMTIFHHTKDMKLDPALLFVSISAFMVFYGFIRGAEIRNKKETYTLLAIIWVLIGLAFSIKVTTLMLLLGIFALWSYRMMSFWGYMGFFFSFLAIFTGANLWSIMNVWMPRDSGLLLTIATVLLMTWVGCYIIAYRKYASKFQEYFVWSIVLILGFILGILPWIVKNTLEVQPWNNPTNIETKSLILQSALSWSGAGFRPDFLDIMSKEEYDKKTDIIASSNIDKDGQSRNEDLWRYFGYEEGINNYLKLPLNLTFQRNQSGEFTSITYIFLALIPVLYLFARGRRSHTYTAIVYSMLVLMFAYGFMGKNSWSDGTEKNPMVSVLTSVHKKIVENDDYRTAASKTNGTFAEEFWEKIKISGTYMSDIWNLLVKRPIILALTMTEPGTWLTEKASLKFDAKYPLLYGYLILLIINIAFISTIHFLTKSEEEDMGYREMSVMLNTYGFLFLVSAFGIVWYGIFVYFIFFALIWLLSERFTIVKTEDKERDGYLEWKYVMTGLLFIFISLYFIRTAIPHAWSNLRNAGFNEYKYNILNQEETLFAYRSDYLVPIANMNLQDTGILTDTVMLVKSQKLKEVLGELAKNKDTFLEWVSQILPQIRSSRDATLKNDAKILSNAIYDRVLYPDVSIANTGWIYRIGTFMTYLINKNNTRYYDDSLIFGFDGYFYDESPEKTIEKMQKLGFKFLLIDLNAATIDRDPRRALTERYERLLLTMRAKNLRLISTDSICLKFTLGEYKNGKYQSRDEFINMAWVNYESYTRDGSGELIPVSRGIKQSNCYNAILKAAYEENSAQKYPYLAPLKNAIESNNAAGNQNLLSRILMSFAGQSFFALYEITDIPVEVTVPTSPTGTGATE